jgi:hypothetical protein
MSAGYLLGVEVDTALNGIRIAGSGIGTMLSPGDRIGAHDERCRHA